MLTARENTLSMLNFLLSLSCFLYLSTSASGGKPRGRAQELPSDQEYAGSLEACAQYRLYEKTVSGKCSSTAIHGTDVPLGVSPAGTVTVEIHVQVEVDSEYRCTARTGRNSDNVFG